MPGIVGLITRMPRQQAEQQLWRMVSALLHESFYDVGVYVNESQGVYAGWIARKNSFSGRMPVSNERGDAVLVFSGEEYSGPDAARGLEERGHRLDENVASYLVHWYEEDEAFPAGLNGRFHGIVTDANRGTATLFNDRYGLHRLYYHEAKDALYFAAEAKAILAVLPELRSLDPEGLGEFIACGCVLENRTLFKRVHVLPPASVWTFRGAALERRGIYFHPKDWEEQSQLEPASYYQELREVFSRALPRNFLGREMVGVSLTGGLDTRMIMAWRKVVPGMLPCYTFGSAFRECQDVAVARRVAEACGQSHQVIPVGERFLSRFSRYAERAVYLTDGCVSVSRCPDLYMNELAAQIAPVRLTGNYGSEVLRSVRAFKPVDPAPGLIRPEVLTLVRAAGETYGRLVRAKPLSFAVFRQAPWYHYGLLALEQTQLSVRTPYLDNEFVRTVYRAPAACTNDVCLRLIADGDPALACIPTDRGIRARRGLALTAVSRSIREFSFKAEYAYDSGMPQSLARIDSILAPLHLERVFLGRHKFCHFRVWYRDELSEYVREMLLDPRTLSRPFLDRNVLESLVRGHLHGDRNHTRDIHLVLTLELIHRAFLDPR